MRIQVSGKQIDIGDALRGHVEGRIGDVIGKYADRAVEAVVIFSRDRHEFVAEGSVHLPTGLTAQAKGHASEVYAAIESCREKMDKQLRRHKRRLKDHHRERSQPVEFDAAGLYVLAAEDDESAEGDSLAPVIVAEMETQVPTISVGEAVMQMELSEKPLLVFRNEKHGGVNVVYRREDGHVGWIDPRNSK